jgi:glycosyltransferase involved in cell wall biosynthesis
LTDERQRILIISHGHPDHAPGGGEYAAHLLFRELAERAGVTAIFLARSDGPGHPGAPFALHTADGSEVLMTSQCEIFRFSQRDQSLLCRDFRAFLEWYRPTVVHLHHYVHIGIEILREIRNYSRSTAVVLTLHEYLAICNNSGQMVKTNADRLCYRASPAACHGCFPEASAEDFFLRELYLKSFLDLVDVFISPSRFLVERYVAWGLPREKFVVVENGLDVQQAAPPRQARPNGTRGRFAFFGQISRFKGLHVLLEAIDLLPGHLRTGADGISLDVHGAHLTWQTREYQDRISDLIRSTARSVRMLGRYRREDLPALMRGVDWVVIPSTWWENSPLVIQEAFAHGRPVICSDIGGMAEKVQNGQNGIHFRVGNPRDLADRLVEAATTPGLWERLRAGIQAPWTVREMADRHLEIYDRLAEPPRTASSPSLRVV